MYLLGIYDEDGEELQLRVRKTEDAAKLAYSRLKQTYGDITVWVKKVERVDTSTWSKEVEK